MADTYPQAAGGGELASTCAVQIDVPQKQPPPASPSYSPLAACSLLPPTFTPALIPPPSPATPSTDGQHNIDVPLEQTPIANTSSAPTPLASSVSPPPPSLPLSPATLLSDGQCNGVLPQSSAAATPAFACRPRSHSDSALHRVRNSPVAPATSSTPAVSTVVPPFTRRYPLEYALKWRGQHAAVYPYMSAWDMLWAFVGSFLGIALPALLSFNLLQLRLSRTDLTLIVGSFGATAVLLYSTVASDLAQPRSVLGGHIVSAFIGVCVRKMFPVHLVQLDWLACALAVSLAIVAMNATRTLHPPGGATALIAVLPSAQIQDLGFTYIGIPIASGVACMLLVALIVNNLPRRRTWPKYWY